MRTDRHIQGVDKRRTRLKKGNVVPEFMHYAIKMEHKASFFLNNGIKRRRVTYFTLRPLCTPVKSSRYPLNRSLCGPRAGLDVVQHRNISAPAANRTRSTRSKFMAVQRLQQVQSKSQDAQPISIKLFQCFFSVSFSVS